MAKATKKRAYIPGDFGPEEPLKRGDRVIEAHSDRGGARRAVSTREITLTDMQRRAGARITRAYRALTAGLFAKGQSFERHDRGVEPDWPWQLARDVANYKRWIAAAGIVGTFVIDHIVDGEACDDIDRRLRWKKGQAAEAVRVGLDLYCEMEEGR